LPLATHWPGFQPPSAGKPVSWVDCQEFCQKLTAKTGNRFRLPTEEGWEYACRAGTTTPFFFGDTITTDVRWLSRACAWVGGCLQTSWSWVCSACGRVAACVAAVWSALPALLLILWTYRKPLLIALAVGLVIGLGCYLAGPLVASTVSGLMGFLGALIVNLLQRLRQLMEAVRVRSGWLGESN
jgi:hypothetical protein